MKIFFVVPSAGVDPPPACGLSFPPIVAASAVTANAIFTDSTASTVKGRSSFVHFICNSKLEDSFLTALI